MTIRQLESRCWTAPGLDDERKEHFTGNAAALKAIKEARERGEVADSSPLLLESCCWVIECDGECGQLIDEEDEGYIHHCESRAEAEDSMRAWKWGYVGELVFCVSD